MPDDPYAGFARRYDLFYNRALPAHFRPFDAVVCLATSIGHMPDEGEALQSMRGVLREGGLLILNQGTSDAQWREKPRRAAGFRSVDFYGSYRFDAYDKATSRRPITVACC